MAASEELSLPLEPRASTTAESTKAELSRRAFLGRAGTAAAAGAAGIVLPAMLGTGQAQAAGLSGNAQSKALRRRKDAYEIRLRQALENFQAPLPLHPDNGDEALHPGRIGNFSKSLPHNGYGEVDLPAYGLLLAALDAETPAGFDAIPHGCPTPSQRLKLVNPQSGLAFDLEGADSHQLAIPPAPRLDSAEAAGEIVENYWMAHLRDVAFSDYASDPLAAAATADLNALSDFRGPRVAGAVTPQTLFRGNLPGTLTGPFLSQFLWKPMPYGAQHIESRVRTTLPGIDYLTSEADWLSVQDGNRPTQVCQFDSVRRYIRNGRDLGQWVHVDVLFQAYFQAALLLMTPPDASDPVTGGGVGAALNSGNPYNASLNQSGFATFGGPYFATILCEVATRALKAVWYEKWFVHRRLRPEEYGGRVHHKLVNNRPYPLHSDVLASQAIATSFSNHGTYLLPQAFPEGCPIHPAYGAGHATVAGACVTILKALFDESFVIQNPVEASADGLALLPYSGPALTIGGELNKLATNVALGRNIAGVHWRSDATESLKLGEAVAISLLKDQRPTCRESFQGYTFTRFDGTPVTV